MGRFQLKSPKATQIKSVLTKAGSTVEVSTGDLLIELQDLEERKILSTIQRNIDENLSKISEITGDLVKAKILHLNEISVQRLSALKATQVQYERVKLSENFGSENPYLVQRERHSLALRTYQSLQAVIEAKISQRNIDDSLAILKLVDGLLNNEKLYVDQFCRRLKITSPVKGRFQSFVEVNEPVPIGYVLGEIG
jgi:hypothetical protein